MDDLTSLQEEIGEKLCKLSREKLAELCVSLHITKEIETNATRLSLLNILSNHMLRAELDELEDDGMAELLTINEKLSELMGTNVDNPGHGLEREEGTSREEGNGMQEIRQNGNMSESFSSMRIGHAMPQNTEGQQGHNDHNPVSSVHVPQRQVTSIWHKDFKISGLIGEPGQRDRLSFSSLVRQIESGVTKGYPEQEIIDSVIKAITPGFQLRSYLEGKAGLTLPVLRHILRSHYQEKNQTELYKQLTTEVQRPKETPQSFLIRVLDLRQKILFASQEDDSGLKYDPALVQNMFLHTVLTGLQNDRIQSDLQQYLSNPTITDEVLLEKLNVACSNESERQSKRKGERTGTVHVVQLDDPEPKCQPKNPKFDLMTQLKSLSEDVLHLKETIQQPLPVSQQCWSVYNKEPVVTATPQHHGSFQGFQSASGWTPTRESQTWGADTVKCQQRTDPYLSSHPLAQSRKPVMEQYIPHNNHVQFPFVPQEHLVQSSQQKNPQCMIQPQPPVNHYAQPYVYPPPQPPLTMLISYASQPLNFATTPYYAQQYVAPPQPYPHQLRPPRHPRASQCFHCQQCRSVEPCTHCLLCGSSEHFSAGCKSKGTRPQAGAPLNRSGLPPRDRE